MLEWLESRLIKIEYAFGEFPKLKWLSIFYVTLVFLALLIYQPLIIGLYKFNIMGMYVFQEIIKDNVDWVIWGQVIVPLVIAFICYLDVISLYEDKYIRRYGQLPKWVN